MSKPIISVLTPTRGRPDLARRMYTSGKSTASSPASVQFLFYLDEDDPERVNYLKNGPPFREGPPVRVGEAWNALARACCGDILMMGNDDLVFRTPGWDEALRQLPVELPDGVWCAWCNDLSPKAAVRCAFPIVSREWYRALGYFMPECFNFLWHDAWIWDLGKRVNREVYYPEVEVEHRHFAFKKAQYDTTYRRHRVGPEQAAKRRADVEMFAATADTREEHARQLREIMIPQ